MATIVWCDRVRHIVEEPRTDVAGWVSSEAGHEFVYLTPVGHQPERPHQIALRVSAITSFEAVPGDPI